MMMTGDHPRPNPTVQIPNWDYAYVEDSTAHIHSPIDASALAALQRYLPSNKDDVVSDYDDYDIPVDAYSCDNFRMYEFKVKKCAFSKSHDWTECPFAHPGEKARRRDPRKYHYSGSACPNFRRGECEKGDVCEYAHGVFESWLHPARYRTQPCKDGTHCKRRVCFFAHTPEQLRVLPYSSTSPESSPSRLGNDSFLAGMGLFGSSPKSTLYSPPQSSDSPPVSPVSLNSIDRVAESMRCLQLSKMKKGMGMGLSMSPPSWVGSPRSPRPGPGFMSLPSTPIQAQTRSGLNAFDAWGSSCEEEPLMERVESGQELRERIYAKLGRENSLDRGGRVDSVSGAGHDFGWVAELVK